MREIGVLEWFQVGEYKRVESVVEDLKRLGVRHLRTGVFWKDYQTGMGRVWYDWLFPRLAAQVEVLPVAVFSPPPEGLRGFGNTTSKDPQDYTDFIDVLITWYGQYFSCIELWPDANLGSEWAKQGETRKEPQCELLARAACWAHVREKKAILGGRWPLNTQWLRAMGRQGVLQHIDAIGVHASSSDDRRQWKGWPRVVEEIHLEFEEYNPEGKVWITDAGHSTWHHDEYRQLLEFLEVIDAPVERVYWNKMMDRPDDPTEPRRIGIEAEAARLNGMRKEDGTEKLLFRMWSQGGIEKVRSFVSMLETQAEAPGIEARPKAMPIRQQGNMTLVTGGAGFIGVNFANQLLREGRRVLIYDNLSGEDAERNLRWLCERYGGRVAVEPADMRDRRALRSALRHADRVVHLAARTADNTFAPQEDFEVNCQGTLSLLQELKSVSTALPLVHASTSRIYGSLDDVLLIRRDGRLEPGDATLRQRGIGENTPVVPRGSTACSRCSAEQYAMDWAREHKMPIVIIRFGDVYGPFMNNSGEGGWLSEMISNVLLGSRLVMRGEAECVRDLMHVDDALKAVRECFESMQVLAGQVVNVGGGPANAPSLQELTTMLCDVSGEILSADMIESTDARRYYVTDNGRFSRLTGWNPSVPYRVGIERLYYWMMECTPGTVAVPGA